jgi:acyl carrier protein
MTESKMGWDEFAETVADIANVPRPSVQPASCVLEDLGLDSFALSELVAWLLIELDMATLESELADRDWSQVTVGELFTEYQDEQSPPLRERYMIRTRSQQ